MAASPWAEQAVGFDDMKVSVFGSGGRTGRDVVDEALVRGHAVTAVARRPPDPPVNAAAETVVADLGDSAAVTSALGSADAVVSAMGPVGDDPGTEYSDGIVALVESMKASTVRRIVLAANARVLDDRPLEGPYAAVSEEHRRALDAIRRSTLDWTVVATPMLSDAEPRHSYTATVDGRGEGRSIVRRDYAVALLDALDHDDWVRHIVDVTD
jgi:putative NADH-flavin reductase